MTKDHWVCETLSHDWLVDIACLSGYINRHNEKGCLFSKELIIQSVSTVTHKGVPYRL